MHLAIDVGNTSVSLGWFEGLRIARRERVATREFTPQLIRHLTHSQNTDKIDGVTLASVVPAVFEQFSIHREDVLSTARFKFLSAQNTEFSFPIEASPRARVGIDRLVNAEAVWRENPGQPALILDCGTATTLSVLHPTRGFLGGAIAPGIELMRDSLARGGAQLFEVPLEAPPSAIGSDTQAALRAGIVFGYASMVDGLIERMRTELRQTELRQAEFRSTPVSPSLEFQLFATGGNARHLLGVSRQVTQWDPDLTLRGIASLA